MKRAIKNFMLPLICAVLVSLSPLASAMEAREPTAEHSDSSGPPQTVETPLPEGSDDPSTAVPEQASSSPPHSESQADSSVTSEMEPASEPSSTPESTLSSESVSASSPESEPLKPDAMESSAESVPASLPESVPSEPDAGESSAESVPASLPESVPSEPDTGESSTYPAGSEEPGGAFVPPTDVEVFPNSYDIKLSWPEGSQFQMNLSHIWNPSTHSYEGWETTGNRITVENNSMGGVPVKITLSFSPSTETGLKAKFIPTPGDSSPADFRVTESGQISFYLPRSNGDIGATVCLSVSGESADGRLASGSYYQIGSINLTLQPEDAAASWDDSIWVEPGQEEPIPPSASSMESASSADSSSNLPETEVSDTTAESGITAESTPSEPPSAAVSSAPSTDSSSQASEPVKPEPPVSSDRLPDIVAPELPQPNEADKPPEGSGRLPEIIAPPSLPMKPDGSGEDVSLPNEEDTP